MPYIALLLAALFFSGAAIAQDADKELFEQPGSDPEVVDEHEPEKPGDKWYADWDTNDDDVLDEKEFDKAYKESGTFDEWDVNDDAYLTEAEYGDGLYNSLDEDDSGSLEEDEVKEVGFRD